MSTASRPLREAKRDVREAVEARRLHRKMCRTCTEFTGTRRRWCDEGWSLEKRIRDGGQLVEQLSQEADGQGVLFGRTEAGSGRA